MKEQNTILLNETEIAIIKALRNPEKREKLLQVKEISHSR